MAAQPLGDEDRFLGVLALDHRVPRHLDAAVGELLEFLQRKACAHARAARQRRGEAHAVQAVVHAHLAVAEAEGALGKVREQRERQETVRDGAAERRAFRPLAIDVDPLEVVDRPGEGVDALLAHLDPGRDADLLAEAAFEVTDVHFSPARNWSTMPTSCAAARRRAAPEGSMRSSSALTALYISACCWSAAPVRSKSVLRGSDWKNCSSEAKRASRAASTLGPGSAAGFAATVGTGW